MAFELLTSTRYDIYLSHRAGWNNVGGAASAFLLLHYHYERLLDNWKKHNWPEPSPLTFVGLESACIAAVEQALRQDSANQALKVRVVVTNTGAIQVTTSPVPPFRFDPTAASFFNPLQDSYNPHYYGPQYTLYINPEATPSSLFTCTKTTRRDAYNHARALMGITTYAYEDVILHNEDGIVTETTIFNIAFYRDKCWVTPPSVTGCLPGVFRRWLLQENRIREVSALGFTLSTLNEGDWVLLFNSVQGCRMGRIKRFKQQQ